MGTKDIIITPIFFLFFYLIAYSIRPLVTNAFTKSYFIPALTLKFFGAIFLGIIYQFYYQGGDTFTFHTHGSRWLWQALLEDPMSGIRMFFMRGGEYDGNVFKYTSKIWLYRDNASYFVMKIAAFFDLFTINTYTSTTLFFASFSFSGNWMAYTSFQKLYPSANKILALAMLYIPSVIFWGSGILKDSITFGALCWMTHLLFQIAIWKKKILFNSLLLIFFGWIIYSIKIYILLCFLIAGSLFLYKEYSNAIKNTVARIIITPFFVLVFLGGGFFTMQKISEGDSRYALNKIGQTAKLTAYDIRYGWGARHGENSGYTLGKLDGSILNLIQLAPKGIVVSLFRPWLWEVKNPLMLLAAFESLILLILTIYTFAKIKWSEFWRKVNDPVLLFCLSFSLIFAIAVGVSTFNFGSLMRYKIPVIPFFCIALILLSKSYKGRKY